ncbi:MAG: hypothetical protein V7707_10820 [Motiliproteus sp.]
MPNSDAATAKRMDSYLVAPATLTRLTGIEFDIDRRQASQKDSRSVTRPKGCSLK